MRTDELNPDGVDRRLASVIGENARHLRKNAGLTLDQVSIAARMRGLNWSESRVADFEYGRVAPNLATLIAVCYALTDAGCGNTSLPDLLRSSSPIEINDSFVLVDKEVFGVLSGRDDGGEAIGEQSPGSLRGSFTMPPADIVNAAVAAFKPLQIPKSSLVQPPGATEDRTRKALGISSNDLSNLSRSLWKRTFAEERDRRAGAGANAQKRGQVTRQMRAELEVAMRTGAHGDDQ